MTKIGKQKEKDTGIVSEGKVKREKIDRLRQRERRLNLDVQLE